jgi:hypothetical protein
MPVRKLWIPFFLLILPASGGAFGQTSLGGEVGTDLDMHDFSNSLTKAGRDYVVQRRLSRQYLALNFLGPLVTREFADMMLKARLTGIYLMTYSENDGIAEDETNYLNPELDHILSSLSLFPLRTYTLRYTFGKTKTYTNRYEPGRRVDSQVQSPNLAVIRRYQSDNLSHSVQGKVAMAENVNFSTEVKHQQNNLQRQYDFDENLDIWAIFTSTTEDPSPTHRVDIVNTLDDLVLVYIDLVFADSLSAGEMVTLTVDKGIHEVEFVPSRFNSYRATVDVQSFMRWRIVYNAPKGSSDQDQTSNNLESKLSIGGEGRFKNETRFLYDDLKESVQQMSSTLNSLNNISDYKVRPGLNLQMLTNYSSVSTDISDIVSENSTFLNQILARMSKRGGPGVSLSHSYNRMQSINFDDKLRSRTHVLNGQGNIPTMFSGHSIELRTTATFLADNKNYTNNQYMAGITNKLDRKSGRYKFRPQHELKYITSSVDNPIAGILSKSSETESRLRFEGERSRIPGLGVLRIKTDWEWRSRDTQTDTEVMNRYFGEIGISKEFTPRVMLTVSFNKELEVYTLDVKDLAAFGNSPPSPRPDQDRIMLRMHIQTRPWGDLNLGANGMIVNQNSSKISRFSLSLSGRLPGLNTPIRSFLVNESRELEGLPAQSLLQLEAQLSYRFREISLILAYSLNKEKLIAEDYTYSKIYAKLSRSFELY